MKLLSIDNYIDFNCIGGECPISCCGGAWSIEIEDAFYQYYMSVEGEFGEELKEGILRNGERKVFKLDEKTRDCVFLNENKLCRIYRELGPDALCRTCRTYPRCIFQVGDIKICYLTNSCPEVNRMIIQRKDLLRTLYDDLNEDMSGSERDIADKTDPGKFNDAIRAFTTGMHIMQNRDISLGDRIFLILFYIERFQNLFSNDNDVSELINIFSGPEIYTLFLENRNTDNLNYVDKIHVFMMIYRIMMTYSYDHSMWKRCTQLADDIVNKGMRDVERLELAFLSTKNEEIQKEFEQIITYRYFAVFMQGFENGDYFEKFAYELIVLAALEAYIALTESIQERKCTQEDRILFYSLCGRIDHNKVEKEHLVEEIKKEGFYSMDKLIGIIN